MKRSNRILASILAGLLLLTLNAMAETTFDGHVVADEVRAVSAPFGGIVESVDVRVGQPIALGDPVATIATTKVYAATDGTISGVFAKPGDAAEGIEERYGGLVYIEPTHRYVITADNEKAYNSSATHYVHIGETVYISCVKDGSHTATAVVTSIADQDDNGNTPFKLEVIGGDLYMGETVAIYRDKNYSNASRIGRGTVQQNTAVAIKGSGSVLKMHVQVGEHVERGEILFETVEGVLDGLYAMDNTIVSPMEGIVASVDAVQGSSVEKNGKLISVNPKEALQIEIKVSELDLKEIHEGDKVTIEFEWDMDSARQIEGVVSSISRVGEERTDKNADAVYNAYIDFTPDDFVRLDMTVSVYAKGDDGDDEAAVEADSQADAEGEN